MFSAAKSGSGAGPRARCRAAALAICAALLAGGALAGCAGNDSRSHVDVSYGSLPTFLPTAAAQVDTVLTGTTTRPALTVEGDAVDVVTPQGTATVTVAGPEVPGSGLPYQTPSTTCTWTVTMAKADGPIPITLAGFTSLDHLGKAYHPALVPGQPKPPATIKPGQTVTFELRVVMVVGEGLMRYAPDGTHIAASWDFVVEND